MSALLPAKPGNATELLAATENRSGYRDYDQPGIERVRQFYRNNHTHQTYAFGQEKRAKWLKFDQREMTPWEGLDFLNTLVDESDPDINLPQISHLLQTAEAIRADGHPDWFVLTGFIHDLGKVLCLFGEPQWAVVGNTLPVGCKFSDKIVYPEFLR
jgi:inositol oxygenase